MSNIHTNKCGTYRLQLNPLWIKLLIHSFHWCIVPSHLVVNGSKAYNGAIALPPRTRFKGTRCQILRKENQSDYLLLAISIQH